MRADVARIQGDRERPGGEGCIGLHQGSADAGQVGRVGGDRGVGGRPTGGQLQCRHGYVARSH